jgi:hypothetical protein
MKMKNKLLGTLVILGFVLGFYSCAADQCTTCSYTDPTNNELITEPEVCGNKNVVETKEASAELTADFLGATDFSCTRK